jgi:hypothetical protein
MKTIKATWTNGQIVPAEPVDWPEGAQLRVEPVPAGETICMAEEEADDDPESPAAWIAAVNQIEPLIWAEGERETYERYCVECRQFNMAAVRKQMDAMPDGDAP